jgi:hypothetical protein
MRPVIRQQRKRNAAQLFRPALEAGNRIGADLEDFTVQLLEFFVVRTEPVDLIGSPRRKGERHKRDHGRPTLEAGERDLLIGIVRGKRKIGRCHALLDVHLKSPSFVLQRGARIPVRIDVGNRTAIKLPSSEETGQARFCGHRLEFPSPFFSGICAIQSSLLPDRLPAAFK